MSIKTSDYDSVGAAPIDLLAKSAASRTAEEADRFHLEAGAAFCLAATAKPAGLAGDDYRRARAQSAWAITALEQSAFARGNRALSLARIGGAHSFGRPRISWARWRSLTGPVPARDLLPRSKAAKGNYPQVVTWTALDRRRITLVPPGHWLLLQDPMPFSRHIEVRTGRRGRTC